MRTDYVEDVLKQNKERAKQHIFSAFSCGYNGYNLKLINSLISVFCS